MRHVGAGPGACIATPSVKNCDDHHDQRHGEQKRNDDLVRCHGWASRPMPNPPQFRFATSSMNRALMTCGSSSITGTGIFPLSHLHTMTVPWSADSAAFIVSTASSPRHSTT